MLALRVVARLQAQDVVVQVARDLQFAVLRAGNRRLSPFAPAENDRGGGGGGAGAAEGARTLNRRSCGCPGRHHLLRLLVERLEHHAEQANDHLLRTYISRSLSTPPPPPAGGGGLLALAAARAAGLRPSSATVSRAAAARAPLQRSVSAAPRAAPARSTSCAARPWAPRGGARGRAATGGGCIERLPPARLRPCLRWTPPRYEYGGRASWPSPPV